MPALRQAAVVSHDLKPRQHSAEHRRVTSRTEAGTPPGAILTGDACSGVEHQFPRGNELHLSPT